MASRRQVRDVGDEARVRRDPVGNRKSILAAASAEFSENGYSGASVNKIADRANTSKRMLYHYYGDKEHLFIAVLEATYADIRAAERELELELSDPEKAIERLVIFTWDYYLENPQFIALLNNENLYHAEHLKRSKRIQALHSPFVDMLRQIADAGAKKGVFRNGVDPVQLYITIASISYFYFSNIHTLGVVFGRDLGDAPALKARRDHVVDVILSYLKA